MDCDPHLSSSLRINLFLFLGLPFCAACLVWTAATFVVLLVQGELARVDELTLSTLALFFLGPLVVVSISTRSWLRVRRGEAKLTLLSLSVPLLLALGALFGAAAFAYAYSTTKSSGSTKPSPTASLAADKR